MRKKVKLVVLCATVGTALLAAASASAWTVTVTAQPELKRTHSWKIEKTVSKSSVTLKKGESTTVSYSVTVGPAGAPVDSDWGVKGTLEMSEDPDITINSVIFRIEPELIVASQACMPMTFPVDLGIEGLKCTYSAPLPDAGPRTTWMRATRGDGGFRNARAAIDFGTATVNEVDECVTVTDSMAGALGTVCAADAPKTFTYTRTIGPFMECGSKTVGNVASYKAADSGAMGSASASVAVTVTCPPPPPPDCKPKKDKKHGWYGWGDKGKKGGYGGHDDDDDCRDDDDDDCRDKGKKDHDRYDKHGKYGKGGHDDDDCRDDDDRDHDRDHDRDDKCRGDHKYRDGKGGGWR